MAQGNFNPVNFQRGNYRIEVIRKPNADAVEVYLLATNGLETFSHHMEKGQLVATSIKEGEDYIVPLLRVSGFVWGDIVRAITNDLPNVSREEIDAELKATKYHLEDMRKLVLGESTNVQH